MRAQVLFYQTCLSGTQRETATRSSTFLFLLRETRGRPNTQTNWADITSQPSSFSELALPADRLWWAHKKKRGKEPGVLWGRAFFSPSAVRRPNERVRWLSFSAGCWHPSISLSLLRFAEPAGSAVCCSLSPCGREEISHVAFPAPRRHTNRCTISACDTLFLSSLKF